MTVCSLEAPVPAGPPPGPAVEWQVSPGLTDYAEAVAEMEARAAAIREGTAPELVWLLEHPPVITAGTSAPPEELLSPDLFPVHRSGRGGRHTYHGPGQRVGYVMLDLNARGRDVRCYVAKLERWLIASLARLGVSARTAEGRIGIWTDEPGGGEAKVGAIGVRVRRWVTLHGFSINVAPDMAHFGAIVPCGIADHGVTSLERLGCETGMSALDQALEAEFPSFLWSLSQVR
ncbi:lipoyl(octanoyl) transferase LipB [Sphingomonas sp. AP4-R1]|uniref:lipoyl(octanoyl) transferase LipB n=1 Tax=Sphingomonas sp. AP4-R1 TaxID=2735134 RepID=UPI0014939694|nr:lipoyl(octanoyl) transferase LipB [Sphingomonas sp. AP4-R1]QJU56555.1 lipoyl(octanoyl) transferase LipB [Sphingomonas sp. AP4-R1]